MVLPDLEPLAVTYGVHLLLKFGSSVTGTRHPHSDLDLAVLLERPELTLEGRAALQHDLQRLFPEREVDLVVLNHADPLLLKQVTDHCRLLYGSAAELQRLMLHAFKRYQDYRPYLDLERRFVARALAAPDRRG